MFDIDVLTKMVDEHPLKPVFFSKEADAFIDEGEAFSTYADAVCFWDGDRAYGKAKRNFRERHMDLFPNIASKYSPKEWKEIIEKSGLKDEWIKELRLSVSFFATSFCCNRSIHERETDPSTYQKIREMLEKLEKAKFEERYSDKILFKVKTPYSSFTMCVLGNAKKTYGLTFYPDDPEGWSFYLLANGDSLNMDMLEAHLTLHAISFYYEKSKASYSLTNNPYGKDNRYTSTYLCYGSLMHSLLPGSVGIMALYYLEEVYRLLLAFDKSEARAAIKSLDKYHEVKLKDNAFAVTYIRDPFSKLSHDAFPPACSKDCYYDDLLTVNEGAFDATIRILDGFYTSDYDIDRAIHFSALAMICDHDTGKIIACVRGETGDFRPLHEVTYRLSEALKELPDIPKTIYVNGFFDELYYESFFCEYISKKKIKLKVTHKPLATDPAYEGLHEFLKVIAEKSKNTKKRQS